jgi:hypothetical protein
VKSERELHTLAVFVHGSLSTLHGLGAVYNARRSNNWQCWAHLAGLAFSVYATVHHIKETK